MNKLDVEGADIITKLILDKKWNYLHEKLAKDSHLCNHFYQSKCSNDCSRSHNILHFALQHSTPFYIIRYLVSLNPTLVNEVNCMGHFPFQTALTHGTFPAILKCLLEGNEKSSEVLDMEGKTSLHLVFDAYKKNSKINCPVAQKIIEYYPQVIHYVYSLNPLNILKDDRNGVDVLEYAKGKEIEYSTMRMLQEMSMDAKMKDLHPRVEFVGKEGAQKIKRNSFTQKMKRNTLRKFASSRF